MHFIFKYSKVILQRCSIKTKGEIFKVTLRHLISINSLWKSMGIRCLNVIYAFENLPLALHLVYNMFLNCNIYVWFWVSLSASRIFYCNYHHGIWLPFMKNKQAITIFLVKFMMSLAFLPFGVIENSAQDTFKKNILKEGRVYKFFTVS